MGEIIYFSLKKMILNNVKSSPLSAEMVSLKKKYRRLDLTHKWVVHILVDHPNSLKFQLLFTLYLFLL